MSFGRFFNRLEWSLLGIVLAVGASVSSDSLAQDEAKQAQQRSVTQHHDQTGEFIKVVREATFRFKDVSVAVAEGYVEQFGCVSGSDEGAMGVHYVNFPMVADPALDPMKPELLVYEPQANGKLKLVAADYLVLADAWDAANPAPPELLGQLFHLFESPNRFGLPPFYTLHVWAWKSNPHGAFVNWHPNVECEGFTE